MRLESLNSIQLPLAKSQSYYVISAEQPLTKGLFPLIYFQSSGGSFFSVFSKQQKKDRYGISKSDRTAGSTLPSCPDEPPFHLQRTEQLAKYDAFKRGTGNQQIYWHAVQTVAVYPRDEQQREHHL